MAIALGTYKSSYYIKPSQVTLMANDQNNPSLVYVGVRVGTYVDIYFTDRTGATPDQVIGYGPNSSYQKWQLSGSSTKLASNAKHYIYIRLRRTEKTAMLIFSTRLYDFYGKNTDGVNHAANRDLYYYILAGELTATDGTSQRELTFQTGNLSTPENSYDKEEADSKFMSFAIADQRYLNQVEDDTAKGIITFLQGIKIGSWEGENTAHSFQLRYDETLDSVVLSRTDGKPAHFLASGAVATRGLGEIEEGGGGTGAGVDLLSVPSDIIPIVGGNYSLGSSANAWKMIYANGGIIGNTYIDSSRVIFGTYIQGQSWVINPDGSASFSSLTINGANAATQNWVNSQDFAKASDLTSINNSIISLQQSTFTGANNPEGYTLTWFTQSGGGRNVTIPAYGEITDGLAGIGQNVALVDQWLIADLIFYVDDAVTGGRIDLTSVASDIIPDGNLTRKLGSSSNRWSLLYVNSINAGTIAPRTDNGWDLGMTTFRWRNLYAVDGHLDSLTIGGETAATQSYVTSQLSSYATTSALSNYVTLNSAQTISGMKTFTGGITASHLYSVEYLDSSELTINAEEVNFTYYGDDANLSVGLLNGYKPLTLGNTSFSPALTSGTVIGTINIGGESKTIYAPSGGNVTSGGKINLVTVSAATISSYMASVGDDGIKMFIVTDSNGNIPSLNGETSITVSGTAKLLLFGKSKPFGVSVGDILAVTKLQCRIIPLNDAKAASGDFPGADGLETVWDKTQINKIAGIEYTANAALPRTSLLPSSGVSNMNDALETGIYVWCTLGRPSGATGAFTCVVHRSSTPDFNNFYTIEQTAYGREAELGQVYKRIIFWRSDEQQYGEWVRVDNTNSADLSNYVTLDGEQTITGSKYFNDLNANSIYLQGFELKPYNPDGSTPDRLMYDGYVLLDEYNYSEYLDGAYVKKSGDTMTGQLTVPNLTVSGNQLDITYGKLLLNRAGINYIWGTGEGGNIAFGLSSVGVTSPQYATLYIKSNSVTPGTRNNTVSLGESYARWRNVYSVLGNFSGQITSSVADGTAPFVVASKTLVSNLNAQLFGGFKRQYNSATNSSLSYIKVMSFTVKGVYTNTPISFRYFGRASGTGTSGVGTVVMRMTSSKITALYVTGDSTFASVFSLYRTSYTETSDTEGTVTQREAKYELYAKVGTWGNLHVFDVRASGDVSNLVIGESSNVEVTLPTTYDSLITSQLGNVYGSATKLSTPRTLWGQSFDGSGNVSGDLTGVGNIYGKGAVTINSVNNVIALKYNGQNATSVLLNNTSFKPYDVANGLLNLGSTSARWKEIYAQNLNLIGNLIGVRTIAASSLLELTSTNSDIYLKCNNTDRTSVVLNAASFKPFAAANGLLNLGASNARWKVIYGQSLDLSEHIYLPNSGMIYAKDASDSNIGLLQFNNINSLLIGQGVAKAGHNTNIYGNTISLAYGTAGSTSNTALYVSSDGNVGIGTTSPAYKLDVNGTFHVSGNATIGGETVATQVWVNSQNFVKASDLTSINNSIISLQQSTFTGANAPEGKGYTLTWFTQSGGGRNVTIPAYGEITDGLAGIGKNVALVDQWLIADLVSYVDDAVTGGRINLTSVASDIIPDGNLTRKLGSSSNRWSLLYVNSINAGTIAPRTDNGWDLGMTTFRWRNLYAVDGHLDSLTIGGETAATQSYVTSQLSSYATTSALSNYVTLNSAQTISERKTFSKGIIGGLHSIEAPNSVFVGLDSTVRVYGGLTIGTGDLTTPSIKSDNVLPKSNSSGSIGSSSSKWRNGYINNLYSDVIYADTLTSSTSPSLNVTAASLDLMSCELYGYDSDGNANWNIASDGIATFNSVVISSNDYIHKINGNADGELVIWPSEYLVIENDTITDYAITCSKLVQTSDIRYKNILSNVHLELADIAAAPTFKFAWANETDGSAHIGTSAQYWQEIAGELVVENKKTGKLGLDYSTAALVSAVSIAREVNTMKMWQTSTTDRIEELEDKVKKLEEENKALRELLNNNN